MEKGSRVIFRNNEKHEKAPEYYPPVGTVGTVEAIFPDDIHVQWPIGSTRGKAAWFCMESDCEVVRP
jgi:hypothetical protein